MLNYSLTARNSNCDIIVCNLCTYYTLFIAYYVLDYNRLLNVITNYTYIAVIN